YRFNIRSSLFALYLTYFAEQVSACFLFMHFQGVVSFHYPIALCLKTGPAQRAALAVLCTIWGTGLHVTGPGLSFPLTYFLHLLSHWADVMVLFLAVI